MIEIDGSSLTLEEFEGLVHGSERGALAPAAREAVGAARQTVVELLERGELVYGVTTGFGDLASRGIPVERTRELQERLLLSHAAGVGEPLSTEAVRGMLALRANTLARGYSGVRAAVIDLLLELLNRGVHPVVPSRGSVGASGDLAPLAHLALPLIGRGRVQWRGRTLPAAEALAECGLTPLRLEPKEGLGLINGTQAMTSLLALAALETRRLVKVADLVGAMSLDAARGSDAPFDARLHELRPHPGQLASAANLRRLMRSSEIRASHRTGDTKVQDPYSFRCMPQVHGAVRDVLADIEAKLEIEMNAVTDNPLIFPAEGDVISGGNFHGEPMAIAADFMTIALCELGGISERRIEKLNQTGFSGLPPFLVEDPGLNSGFMMAQVTAAALVAESKTLAHPASVDSIPTSADKEDHVSMGMGAALKARRVTVNTRRVLAIELLAAAQGIDLLRPLKTSPPLEKLHAALRQRVARWDEDREMAPDLAAAEAFLLCGVEAAFGDLA